MAGTTCDQGCLAAGGSQGPEEGPGVYLVKAYQWISSFSSQGGHTENLLSLLLAIIYTLISLLRAGGSPWLAALPSPRL